MQKLQDVLSILASGKTIPERYRDHPLKSNWKGYRDIHIEPDWILIYKMEESAIILMLSLHLHLEQIM